MVQYSKYKVGLSFYICTKFQTYINNSNIVELESVDEKVI